MMDRRSSVLPLLLLVLLSVAVASCASYRWSPRPIKRLDVAALELPARYVRLTTATGTLSMRVDRVDFPYLHGSDVSGVGTAEVDPNRISSIRFAVAGGEPAGRQFKAILRADLAKALETAVDSTIVFSSGAGNGWLHRVRFTPDRWLNGVLSGEMKDGVRVDLREVTGLEVRELNGGRTALKTVGLVGATAAALVVIVALTKESCPFVYVDRGGGWELVGEAYAGAAFQSTQRGDLLPLPPVGTAERLSVRLRNEARETQYTDAAELVVVDHPSATRALSTFDGHLVLVGAAVSPEAAVDVHGRDVAPQLRVVDDRFVETRPPAMAASPDSLLQDVVSATFAVPAGGAPVLELVAGNTALLDLTFGRFFGAMGAQLPQYLQRGNDSSAGAPIQRWREREGVDLTVDVREATGWRSVAVVPTVGPVALRSIAVPMPASGVRDGRMEVRLHGGLGFWRIDRVGLSVRTADVPHVERITPSTAIGTGGVDQRGILAKRDGAYNVLSMMDESLTMSFQLPARPVDAFERTVFLYSNGYYNVHPPVQATWQPVMLRTIRDEPGALVRFARDLTRVYEKAVAGR